MNMERPLSNNSGAEKSSQKFSVGEKALILELYNGDPLVAGIMEEQIEAGMHAEPSVGDPAITDSAARENFIRQYVAAHQKQ